jgi:hypothetical protein
VLLDTMYIGVPAWDRMDIVIKSWIWGTISPGLQDVTRQRGHMARDAWLALENHFLSNCETHALHIATAFRSFIQGGLSANYYCRKMKGFTDSLTADVTDRVLMLNVLHGLNKNFEHLPRHLHACDALPVIPEGARRSVPGGNPAGNSGAASHCLHPTTLYAVQKPQSSSSSASGQEHPPGQQQHQQCP